MYDYLRGNITYKENNVNKTALLTVEVNSIGYLVNTTRRTIDSLPDTIATIYVTLIHKEDSMSFVGFLSREERDVFNILQSVSGVGSKSALQLLDEFSISELINVVVNENAKELSRAKGIGAKMAQKIIIELKDKIIQWAKATPQSISEVNDISCDSSILEETQTVMLSLGYTINEIREAIDYSLKHNKNIKSSEDILKSALEFLSLKV